MGGQALNSTVDCGVVKVHCRLQFGYPSKVVAEKVARSLRVDDAAYISSTVEGRTLTAESDAASILGLLHTLEDYLACLTVAEKVLRG